MPSRSESRLSSLSRIHRERIAEWLGGLGDRLEEEFARLDVNGDGQITREELQRYGGSGLPAATCEAAQPAAVNVLCSDSERLLGVCPASQWAGESFFALGGQWADADHDGKISLHEFKALGQVLRDVRVLREELSVAASAIPAGRWIRARC